MVQSVTPVSAMASSGGAPDQLRRAVLAGPGAAVDVGEQARGGLLALLGDPQLVWSRLAGCGHVDRRKRVLAGAVTVLVTLGLCLLSPGGLRAGARSHGGGAAVDVPGRAADRAGVIAGQGPVG